MIKASQNEINVPFIWETVKQAGDAFVAGFKQNRIPWDKASLSVQFDAIEQQCLAMLKSSLAAGFPDTPWRGDEFDYADQRQPLALPEYRLCDSMDGALQYMQHLPGWTINLVLVRNGHPHFAVI